MHHPPGQPPKARLFTAPLRAPVRMLASALRRAAATLSSSARGQGAASSQPWLDFVTSAPRARALLLGTSAVCTAGGTAYFVYHYSEEGVSRHMCRVFEAGGVRGWETHFHRDGLPGRVERAQLHNDITALLRRDFHHRQFSVITGLVGTGKSTAVRRAIVELEEPKGAVYFLPPTCLASFSWALANALGFYRPVGWADRLVRLFTGGASHVDVVYPRISEPRATWLTLEPYIVQAAARYAAKHRAPAVLVLDGMELVAKKDPEFFLSVQDFAKKCSDWGILKVVLVFCDHGYDHTRVLRLLRSTTVFSRADPTYEVGDISDKEAVAWLRTEYDVEASRAEALVDTIAGGRFTTLMQYGESSKSVDAISKELDIDTSNRLLTAGLRATEPLFCKLLSSTRLRAADAYALLSRAKVQELVDLRVLAEHPDYTYTFHDRHVTRFMERKVANRRK